MSAAGHLLVVNDLSVSFDTEDGSVHAVDGISFFLDAGEILGVVGESGSGKSVMTSSLIGLTRAENAVIDGTAAFDGVELIHASERTLEKIRGARIALIPQDPMTALDPVLRIGDQIAEQIRAQLAVARCGDRARDRAAWRRSGSRRRAAARAAIPARVLRRHASARS